MYHSPMNSTRYEIDSNIRWSLKKSFSGHMHMERMHMVRLLPTFRRWTLFCPGNITEFTMSDLIMNIIVSQLDGWMDRSKQLNFGDDWKLLSPKLRVLSHGMMTWNGPNFLLNLPKLLSINYTVCFNEMLYRKAFI